MTSSIDGSISSANAVRPRAPTHRDGDSYHTLPTNTIYPDGVRETRTGRLARTPGQSLNSVPAVCTLAIYVRAFRGFPLIVAANRDEFLARPASAPSLLDPTAGVFGGRDEIAGGTWLGVNRRGVTAALLNRRSAQPPNPALRSRGQLCLAMLRSPSAAAAKLAIHEELRHARNPFNLLVADPVEAWVATNHGPEVTLTDLAPGLHLVTNLDLDDPTCPRIARSYQLFAALLAAAAPPPASREFRDRLRGILSAHDTELDPRSPIVGNSLCVHTPEYGTRSSTMLFLDDALCWSYFHANDSPCRVDYQPQAVLQALATP